MDMTEMMQQQQQQPGALGSVLNGDAAAITGTPPSTPQEVEQRKSQWQQVLDDPNMKSTLLRMGLQLMRGTRPGEGVLGAVGRTGVNAMDYFAARNDLDRRRQMEQQQLDLNKANVNSQIQSRNVATVGQQQENTQNAAKFGEWQQQAGLRQQTAQAQYDNLVREGKVDEARLLNEQFKADEAKRKQDFIRTHKDIADQSILAELQAPVAELARTRAQTGASNASAAASASSAQKNNLETRAMQDQLNEAPAWVRALPDKEAQAYAQANLAVKSRAQIESDIRARLHHGFIDDRRGGVDKSAGMDAMAQSLVDQFNADKNPHKGDFDTWVSTVTTPTVSADRGSILALAKTKLRGGTSATPTSRTMTEADVQQTMKSSGRSREEVLAAAKAKGYTITP